MVNPNEAPEGYIAALSVGGYSCYGCAFEKERLLCEIEQRKCVSTHRIDNANVIYIKVVNEQSVQTS